MKKSTIIITLILVLLAVGAFVWYKGKNLNSPTNTETTTFNATVTKGIIEDAINVNGKATLANEQKLRFAQQGKITNIYIKTGDSVKEGDVLATLDKREFFQELSQAQTRIEKTQREISEEIDKANGVESKKMEREIASMERRLEEMEEDLDKAVRTSPRKNEEKLLEINSKKRDLELQKEKYNLDKQSYEKEEKVQDELIKSKIEEGTKLIDDTIDSANIELTEMKKLSRDINAIFGFQDWLLSSGERFDARFISNNYPEYRNQVEESWRRLQDEIKNYERVVHEIGKKNKKTDEAIGIINSAIFVYKASLETLDYSQKAITYTQVDDDENLGLSQEKIDSKLRSTKSLYDASKSKISDLNSKKNTLLVIDSPEKIKEQVLSELRSKKFALETLLDSIKKAELQIKLDESDITVSPAGLVVDKALQRSILEKQSAILDHKDNILTKKEEFAKLRSGKSTNLENLRTTLKDQQAELEKLKTKEESYEIRAPFSGTIRTIKMKIGDIVGGGSSNENNEEKSILLENSDIINIKVALNQLDIIKIKMEQEAEISFEAIPEANLKGKITEISSTPKNSNEWDSFASYEILVSAPREDFPVYSGMNAGVKIVLSKREDVLLVPVTAVSNDTETGETYVNVIENGKITKTPVTTGESSSNGIEILSGLKEGQEVQIIDFNANNFSHKDFTNSF